MKSEIIERDYQRQSLHYSHFLYNIRLLLKIFGFWLFSRCRKHEVKLTLGLRL